MGEKLEYILYLENTVAILTQSLNKWKELYKQYDIDKLESMEKELLLLKNQIDDKNIIINNLELKLEKKIIHFLGDEGDKLLEEMYSSFPTNNNKSDDNQDLLEIIDDFYGEKDT